MDARLRFRRMVTGLLVLLLAGLVAACAERSTPPEAAEATGTPVPPSPQPHPAPSPTADAGGAWPAHPEPGEPTCDDPLGCYGEPRRAGTFDATVVPEASGLAESRRDPGVLYLLDDRPGTSEVWAVRPDGTMLGAITVAGLDALDTESLAVGPCDADDPGPCVYVGDIGDNLRRREHIAVHRFPEPDLAEGVPGEPVDAEVARLTYPDGRHDAEALLVDDAGTVFVVTKAPFDPETGETGEARLYRAATFGDGLLDDLGPLPVPEPDVALHSLVIGNVVTGGDYRDGRVLLRTYDQALEYVAPEPGADLATLADWTIRAVPAPFELQSEAIAWTVCGFYTAGEMSGDLWYVPCRL